MVVLIGADEWKRRMAVPLNPKVTSGLSKAFCRRIVFCMDEWDAAKQGAAVDIIEGPHTNKFPPLLRFINNTLSKEQRRKVLLDNKNQLLDFVYSLTSDQQYQVLERIYAVRVEDDGGL